MLDKVLLITVLLGTILMRAVWTIVVVAGIVTAIIVRPRSQLMPLIGDRLIHAAGLIVHLFGHAAIVVLHLLDPAGRRAVHGATAARQSSDNRQHQPIAPADFPTHSDNLVVSTTDLRKLARTHRDPLREKGAVRPSAVIRLQSTSNEANFSGCSDCTDFCRKHFEQIGRPGNSSPVAESAEPITCIWCLPDTHPVIRNRISMTPALLTQVVQRELHISQKPALSSDLSGGLQTNSGCVPLHHHGTRECARRTHSSVG